jgi:broad specificity phosphatase PhoE
LFPFFFAAALGSWLTTASVQCPNWIKALLIVSVQLLSFRIKEQSFSDAVGEAKQGDRCVPSVQLLRHGAHADVGMRLTGRAPDGGLTEVGRAQALAAAARLEGKPPTAIFASPRRRTRETAAIVAERFGLEVSDSAALDEINFGSWTGARFVDLAADRRWSEWNSNRATARCPQGESQGEAQTRALAFAFEAAAASERPLLVTHCDIIRALHCWAEHRSLDDIHAVSCDPGSLSSLELSSAEVVA